MSVFFSIWIVVVGMLALTMKNYERNFIGEETEEKDRWRRLYPLGLCLTDLWYRKGGDAAKQEHWARAVEVREFSESKFRLRCAKRFACVWIFLLFSGICGLLLSLTGTDAVLIEQQQLERPDFGETRQYAVQVEGVTDRAIDVTVTVAGREPEEEAMKTVFDEAAEAVADAILGKNPSLEQVRFDLELVSTTNYGIRVQWKSLQPEYISSSGRIVATEIPKEGVVVTLQATLSYAAREAFYDINVHLYPPEQDEEYLYQMLVQRLNEAENQNRTEDKIVLPQEIAGKNVKYFWKDKQPSWILVILILAIGILMAMSDRQKLKQEYEDRNHELCMEYPSLLFKLSIMLSCGMTLRGAWERIVTAYQQKREANPEYHRYVYEEMVKSQNQIRAGEGESAVYRAFGFRCEADCYLRLGSYLDQNLKQGAAGLWRMLEREMAQALEERRNIVLRMGETMSTKLLIPMFLMLGVVIAVLITPAILSM